MPLIKGKSPQAFQHNVKAEMHAGKPQNQSLAIAYSMKRKAKKMADGGMPTLDPAKAQTISDQYSKPDTAGNMWDALKKGLSASKAEGGAVEPSEHEVHNAMAAMEDERKLNQHGDIEEGPQSGGEGFHEESYMGNPGNAWDNYQSEAHEDDMVGRIMKMRQQMFSKGGQVANQEHGENDNDLAGFKPNEFDDLVLRDDDLEGADYTGANSGDELGNARLDHDDSDIVARVMKSRAKKDRLPNPR
jgi:hypothetical protein